MTAHSLLLLCLAFAVTANAQSPSAPGTATPRPAATATAPAGSDVVLAENAYVKLTMADWHTELLNIPVEMRDAFAADPRRVASMLNNLLTMKTLAVQARNAGLDRDPETQRRLALETERLLAKVQIQRVEEKAAADFDAKVSDFTERARELYAVEKAKYRTPEQVSVSHILFSSKRGDDVALAAAKDARAKLVAGADFATLAKSLSDDTGTKTAGGHLDWFADGQMDPAFSKAAFAMTKPGEISDIVHSSFGYHIIKFEARRPATQRSFDEVKGEILGDLRAKYINDQRDAVVNAVRNDPNVKANQGAIDALVTRPPTAPHK